jgi:hypothetical protein
LSGGWYVRYEPNRDQILQRRDWSRWADGVEKGFVIFGEQ